MKNVKQKLKQIVNNTNEPDWEIFKSQLDDTIDERFTDEVNRIFDEMKYGPHVDDVKYKVEVESLNCLIDAWNAYKKENKKDVLQKDIEWNAIILVLLKAGISLTAIIFWICLEQGRPTPLRLANWVDKILSVR